MRRIGMFLLMPAAAIVASAVVLALRPQQHDTRAEIASAALAQTSVHWTSTSHRGHDLLVITADVTHTSGQAHVALSGGKASSIDYRLIGNTLFEKSSIGKYAGRWISIPSNSAQFARSAEGLTLSTVLRDVIPPGTVTVTQTTAAGTPLLVVKETSSGAEASLTADARGKPLPVRYSWRAGGASGSTSFGKWGEPVHVLAPARSTPIATARGR